MYPLFPLFIISSDDHYYKCFPFFYLYQVFFVLYFIFAILKSIKLIDGSARMKQIYIGLDCWICGAIQIVCSLILILDNLKIWNVNIKQRQIIEILYIF